MMDRRQILIWCAGAILALACGFMAAYFMQPDLSLILENKPVPVGLRGELQEPPVPGVGPPQELPMPGGLQMMPAKPDRQHV